MVFAVIVVVVGSLAVIVYYRSTRDEFDCRSRLRQLLPLAVVLALVYGMAAIVITVSSGPSYGHSGEYGRPPISTP